MPNKQLELVRRTVTMRAETANADSRSVEVVIASDAPVDTLDLTTGRMIPEVLRMEGLRWRNGNQQLPIVDSHDTSTVRNVLGSVRNLRNENGELVGDAVFASDDESQTAFRKIAEGHLTDFSITAIRKRVSRLQKTDSMRVGKREISGPAMVVDEWVPLDASLTAAGADPSSTVRGIAYREFYHEPQQGEELSMSQELRSVLLDLGMPETTADDQVVRWAKDHLTSVQATPVEQPTEVVRDAVGVIDTDEIAKRAADQERARCKEITAIVTNAKLDRSVADDLIERKASVESTRQVVLEKLIERAEVLGQSSGDVRVKSEGIDRFFDAARDGLISRAARFAGVRGDVFGGKQPAAGYEDFANTGLLRIAERALNQGGIRTERLAPADIARAALGNRGVLHRHGLLERGSDSAAYHVSGMFTNVLLDAANKTLLAAYNEAPYTWAIWARQAASVPDFKNINRIRFSESPNPELVPENKEYPEKKFTDEKESYKVEKYGAIFTVSWETLVNDDLDAISRVPAMHGNAMRRKQNQLVYSILVANPTMGDSYALFSASHTSGSNIQTSGAAPNVTTLNAGFLAMATQTGLNSDTVLNITPSYLIVPQALAATAYQLVASMADPAAGGSAAGNSNTANIYGPNGPRPLTVVPEGYLDASGVTAGWFLAANTSQIDTIELAFLQGEESPVVESEMGFETDTLKIKTRQTMGAKAIDWRGMYYNDGA